MSDWTSTYSAQGVANGGVDLEMPRAVHMSAEKLKPLLEKGIVTEKTIDEKIRRLLRLAVCFGWFDHEQRDETIGHDDPGTVAVSLEVARKCCVLLKNDAALLPLDTESLGKIAVVGHTADPAVISGGGSAYTTPARSVSILEGIRAVCGTKVEVLHATGPRPDRDVRCYRQSRFETTGGQSGIRVRFYDNADWRGSPRVERIDERVDFTFARDKPIDSAEGKPCGIQWSGKILPDQDGEYVLYASANDAAFRIWLDEDIVFDTLDTERGGTHTARISLQAGRPVALRIDWRLTRYWGTMRFGYEPADSMEREAAQALALVDRADAVIVATGHTAHSEREGADRPFGLDPAVQRFIDEVASRNPNTAVVLLAGGNVDMAPWIDKVKALLMAWYPGQEGGTAVADILFGVVNPSGKLPATFEKRLEDRSSFDCYHDDDGDKRVALTDGIFGGYRHFDRLELAPRFPFGFGLSYTTFRYDALELSATRMSESDTVTATVTITNTGKRPGAEVVQLYIRDVDSRLPRPVKELKGFGRIELAPGETGTVSMPITRESLAYYDSDRHEWVCEPGELVVMAAASATDIRHRASLVVE
jgi:beta-glucosidase